MQSTHLLLEEPIMVASILEPSKPSFFPTMTKIVGTLDPKSSPRFLSAAVLMAAVTAARATAMTRSIFSSHLAAVQHPMASLLPRRILHLRSGAGVRSVRRSATIHNLRGFGVVSRIGAIRCISQRPGDSGYSPLNSSSRGGSGFSDRPPTEMAPLFLRCDYEHWFLVMDKPGGEGASKQQMLDCYVQTLSKVLGSEEETKRKIYNVSCERYFGFRCEIDEETSNKLEGILGVLFVLPDSYVDAENKDYGGLLVNKYSCCGPSSSIRKDIFCNISTFYPCSQEFLSSTTQSKRHHLGPLSEFGGVFLPKLIGLASDDDYRDRDARQFRGCSSLMIKALGFH